MVSLSNKKWCLAEPSLETVSLLERQLQLPTALATILTNRGVTSEETAKDFIEADFARLHDPFLMNGMREAVDRVLQALGLRPRRVFQALHRGLQARMMLLLLNSSRSGP